MMRDWIEIALFVVCAAGIIIYSLPPNMGGPAA